jgi:phosphoglycerate dehydrogenase-like enzyme
MKILIASSICQDALHQLSARHEVVCVTNATEPELCSAVADCDAIVFRSGVQINQRVMSSAPNLKLLIRAGSGLDNLDVEYVQRQAIELVRIPEPGAQAVAELAFGLMLNLARQIQFNDGELRKGHWTKQTTTGYVLRDKVLGIVGAGNIGSRVGQMGTAWGMQAIGCVKNPKPADIDNLRHQGIQLTTLEEVIRQADFLTIHVPKTKSTTNLIDAQALSWMKPTSFLVNLSRGGVVDEKALAEALQGDYGPAGAGLDVHQEEGPGKISPLASLPNVILTPHIGASTVDTMREIGIRVIETIESFESRQILADSEKNGTFARRM